MNVNAKQHALGIKETQPVHFLRTRNEEGEPCYFVLRGSNAHISKLAAKKGRESVDVADYGEILASGYGTHPSTRILEMLKKKFDVDLDLSEEE